MGIKEYLKEKNTEVINIEFNCNNFSSYKPLISEVNTKIKNKDITSIFVKIEVCYVKREESNDKFL